MTTVKDLLTPTNKQLIITMRTALIICMLLCAACAAPAEEKKQPKELAEEKAMTKEEKELVPVDSVPEAEDGEAVLQEASAPEVRYNYCPSGWVTHGSECYQFNNIHLSWFDAEEYCKNEGAQLASAKNSQQYRFLQQTSQSEGLSFPWLGGFYLQGRWLWINRDGFYYQNWYIQSTPTSYPCIFLRSNAGWQNSMCTSTRSFICSRNINGC
ncbi:galactose-specific lectin nattectin-like [Halichoeres trimaculatus]|uniref:galactose-specific lectin nattectin-like n=1 Tax=Halichoeres trimaculatus TaxID=147232 RepID=UPI003D9E6C24